MPMLFGLLLAFGAAVATGLASVLQALAVRRARDNHVTHLVVSPLYLGGTALDAVGFVCMLAALHWLPLFLVQCAAAASVGVTAIAGRRVLNSALRRRDLIALSGLGAGLVLLASGAKPAAASAVSRPSQLWLCIAAAVVLPVGFVLGRRHSRRAGGLLATVAGLAFAGTGIASRILSNSHSVTDVVDSPATYGLMAFGLGGMVFFAQSLQRTPVTIATAALFGVETIAASAVGLLLLGDSTRHGFAAPTALGFAVTLGCALALALSVTAQPAGTSHSGALAGDPAVG
jgi:drug/metabolite transporter (DMT)-like permease